MSISRAFRQQDQRQRWKREEQRARVAALHRRTELVSQFGEDRREDVWLLIGDKHEELHGSGFYSTGQIEESTPSSGPIRHMNLTLHSL